MSNEDLGRVSVPRLVCTARRGGLVLASIALPLTLGALPPFLAALPPHAGPAPLEPEPGCVPRSTPLSPRTGMPARWRPRAAANLGPTPTCRRRRSPPPLLGSASGSRRSSSASGSVPSRRACRASTISTTRSGFAGDAILGQWDPPTPSQIETLRQVGDQVQAVLDELNRLYAGEVAAFRKQAAERKVGLFADEPPLSIGAGQ